MPTDFLTDAERERLSTYPEEISSGDLGRFFTLTPHDLEIVVQQRGDHNRGPTGRGFALQLCTLHYLGFIPNNLLNPPPAVVRLLAHQLGVSSEVLQAYGEREQTRSDHLAQILPHLGYRRISPHDLAEIEAWLVERALEHDQPTFLLHTVTAPKGPPLRWDRIVRPGLTTLERIVAAARERAREVTYERVSHQLSPQGKGFLDELVELVELRAEESPSSSRTMLSWLQNMPNDHAAPQIMATLDKIRFLREAGVPT
jgi:hypothetical protein